MGGGVFFRSPRGLARIRKTNKKFIFKEGVAVNPNSQADTHETNNIQSIGGVTMKSPDQPGINESNETNLQEMLPASREILIADTNVEDL